MKPTNVIYYICFFLFLASAVSGAKPFKAQVYEWQDITFNLYDPYEATVAYQDVELNITTSQQILDTFDIQKQTVKWSYETTGNEVLTSNYPLMIQGKKICIDRKFNEINNLITTKAGYLCVEYPFNPIEFNDSIGVAYYDGVTFNQITKNEIIVEWLGHYDPSITYITVTEDANITCTNCTITDRLWAEAESGVIAHFGFEEDGSDSYAYSRARFDKDLDVSNGVMVHEYYQGNRGLNFSGGAYLQRTNNDVDPGAHDELYMAAKFFIWDESRMEDNAPIFHWSQNNGGYYHDLRYDTTNDGFFFAPYVGNWYSVGTADNVENGYYSIVGGYNGSLDELFLNNTEDAGGQDSMTGNVNQADNMYWNIGRHGSNSARELNGIFVMEVIVFNTTVNDANRTAYWENTTDFLHDTWNATMTMGENAGQCFNVTINSNATEDYVNTTAYRDLVQAKFHYHDGWMYVALRGCDAGSNSSSCNNPTGWGSEQLIDYTDEIFNYTIVNGTCPTDAPAEPAACDINLTAFNPANLSSFPFWTTEVEINGTWDIATPNATYNGTSFGSDGTVHNYTHGVTAGGTGAGNNYSIEINGSCASGSWDAANITFFVNQTYDFNITAYTTNHTILYNVTEINISLNVTLDHDGIGSNCTVTVDNNATANTDDDRDEHNYTFAATPGWYPESNYTVQLNCTWNEQQEGALIYVAVNATTDAGTIICTPDWQTTAYTSWADLGSCTTGDNKTQYRYNITYDANQCGGSLTTYTAANYSLFEGTIDNGSLSDTFTQNGQYFTIGEDAGAPASRIQFNFSNAIEETHHLHYCGRYDGNIAHEMHLLIWNYTASEWWRLLEIVDGDAVECHTFLINDTDHKRQNNVTVMINHTSAGNPVHYLDLDALYLDTSHNITNEEYRNASCNYCSYSLETETGNWSNASYSCGTRLSYSWDINYTTCCNITLQDDDCYAGNATHKDNATFTGNYTSTETETCAGDWGDEEMMGIAILLGVILFYIHVWQRDLDRTHKAMKLFAMMFNLILIVIMVYLAGTFASNGAAQTTVNILDTTYWVVIVGTIVIAFYFMVVYAGQALNALRGVSK